jgi:hypothetical protein
VKNIFDGSRENFFGQPANKCVPGNKQHQRPP